MNIILTIIKREYLVRVRKKSFIVMTLLAPLLLTAFYGGIGWLAVGSVSQKKVAVVDQTGQFAGNFKTDKETKFTSLSTTVAQAKARFVEDGYDALVIIPKDVIEHPKTVQIFAEKSIGGNLKGNIEQAISKEIEIQKLTKLGITQQVIADAKVNVDAETISLSELGEKKTSTLTTSIIGGLCAMLIYISVLLYGTQVMRSVLEEKTSRIIEVIISSVKPFQLMMGKIVGVGLVGLTQFLLWIMLTVGLIWGGSAILGRDMARNAAKARMSTTMSAKKADEMVKAAEKPGMMAGAVAALKTLNLTLIIGCFLFYFLGGYLLYSSLYGAIGAAVDSETDTQQFMLPVTLPIIACITLAQFIISDPDGPLAFWMSMIPFTSPIIMMVRIPFGVPGWQLALSMLLLVLGFVGTTWLAARIYRVGILMYGKKPTYRELSKWIFYKA
ncbi:ABC transporter permease [Fibrella aquatilis]|uniref:ABC transporter permease n=1 Tax=Fibrella aquatilis TaxID=2817059 RepID=A0A939JZ63_9BACT|nr:ABC transporter permease [Fibrella aquatilis]MBO0929845.1 ABC transporter permease [Fibrella aquatilis]